MYAVSESRLAFESGEKTIALDGFLPAGERRFPAVLGLHGSGGGHATMAEPAQRLAAQGYAVFVLHYFDRTGTIQVESLQTAFRCFPAWMKTLWDAVGFVSRHASVDPERIGLLGFSLGAYLALSAAAIDSRVKIVVDYFGGFPKEMKLFTRRFCPVLILHGERDATVPVSEAYHLQQLLEKKQIPYEMKIYSDAGHGFDGEAWRDSGLRTLNFLNRYLAA